MLTLKLKTHNEKGLCLDLAAASFNIRLSSTNRGLQSYLFGAGVFFYFFYFLQHVIVHFFRQNPIWLFCRSSVKLPPQYFHYLVALQQFSNSVFTNFLFY